MPFADDLAIAVVGKKEAEVVERSNTVICSVVGQLALKGLEVAAAKTKVVVMAERHRPAPMVFTVGNDMVHPCHTAKYLGIWLDRRRTFQTHIHKAVKKADKSVSALSRLMFNVGGP